MVAFSEMKKNEPQERGPSDPSEQEIEQRSEQIRRGWSKKQVKRRRVNRRDQDSWLPPVIDVRDLEIE